ncbi:MAG TPA: chemotaxis protein CheR, partial [Candidatus Pseudogracilibacillus intestinigallinarum]|nr:chemotaxis protein CheR [Candidatus Pseudogracilibacillus intestinigallinarum]
IKKYFTYKNNVYELNHDIKSMVTFKKHNLLHDTYPANNDLIVCRNVVIYFTDEAKAQVYKNFSEALVSNGVLFVGSTEQIFQPSTYGFKIYDTFFYEKRSSFTT